MLLAIDIGNTNIVVGVFSDGVLIKHWRLATDAERMPDEYAVLLDSLFRIGGIEAGEITGIIMCSVVPVLQSTLQEAVARYWDITPMVVSQALDLGIEVRYSPPHGVGADRIANAVAAIH